MVTLNKVHYTSIHLHLNQWFSTLVLTTNLFKKILAIYFHIVECAVLWGYV